MGRPPKGEKKLVKADAYVSPGIAGEIAAEALKTERPAASLRRMLLEEGWALYKSLGRDAFLSRRESRSGHGQGHEALSKHRGGRGSGR